MRIEHILATLCTLITLPLASCSRVVAHANTTSSEAVPVRTARAVLEDVPLEITAVGNVEAIERVEVKPRIGGQIRRRRLYRRATSHERAIFCSRSIAIRSIASRHSSRRSWIATHRWSNRQKR